MIKYTFEGLKLQKFNSLISFELCNDLENKLSINLFNTLYHKVKNEFRIELNEELLTELANNNITIKN